MKNPLYRKREFSSGFVAEGFVPGGFIVFTRDRCLIAGRNRSPVTIMPDPRRQFSLVSKGAKCSLLARGRTEDGEISEWLVALAILRLFMDELGIHNERLVKCSRWASELEHLHVSDEAFKEEFTKLVGIRIAERVKTDGSEFLADLSKLMSGIESKSHLFRLFPEDGPGPLDAEEQDFCMALEEATLEADDVPTQKAVREKWLSGRSGRNEDHFKRVRNRLGFAWLPAARSGGH